MSTPIKIKDEELAEIKMLQSKFQENILKLGHLQLERMELDKRETQLKENWHNLQKMDQDILDKIVKIYGNGNLNMTDGTFVPTKE